MGSNVHPCVDFLGGRELLYRLPLVAIEGNSVADLRTSRRLEKLSFLTLRSAQDHTLGGVSGNLSCFEVADDDYESTLHLLDRNMLLKATCDLSDDTSANVDPLIVALVGVRVLPDLHNLTNANVSLTQIRSVVDNLLLLCGGFLFLLLLLFLLRLTVSSLSLLSLLLLFLFFSAFLFTRLVSSCLFSEFLLLRSSDFLELFELSFRWLCVVLIWEGDKEAESFNLLFQSGEVLDVVDPPKAVGNLEFLEVHKILEVLSHVQKGNDVSAANILTNEEHSRREVGVQVSNEIFYLFKSEGKLNETEDFESLFGILLSKQNLVQVSLLCQAEHHRNRARADKRLLSLCSCGRLVHQELRL